MGATSFGDLPFRSGSQDGLMGSRRPREPEKAQIVVDESCHQDGNLRMENTLVDEHGDDVSLKKRCSC